MESFKEGGTIGTTNTQVKWHMRMIFYQETNPSQNKAQHFNGVWHHLWCSQNYFSQQGKRVKESKSSVTWICIQLVFKFVFKLGYDICLPDHATAWVFEYFRQNILCMFKKKPWIYRFERPKPNTTCSILSEVILNKIRQGHGKDKLSLLNPLIPYPGISLIKYLHSSELTPSEGRVAILVLY